MGYGTEGEVYIDGFYAVQTASLGTSPVDMATSSFQSHAAKERKQQNF